ncbi:MAG: AAA family ATPase [Nitrospirae bacterium]|nr:AAA family ATPase [Nitrospirota bacterium]
MYKEYFGLEEMPFSIAPDPRYLYMSEQHREALAHLLYGFNSDGGFVLLTGEIGTGKTTVCRCLLERIPENSAIAFIINPKLTVEELLATICDEFGVHYPEGNKSIKIFIDLINSYLFEAHAKGQKAILIIDEAQNLSADVLEQLRLLTNLETNQVKLLQIILLGQPELRDKVSRPELSQLSQRIIARFHLGPLSRKDMASYVRHRLTVAGVKEQLFSDSAVNRLYGLSGGVPRLINVLCDRALLGAFAHGKNRVTSSVLKRASREVSGKPGMAFYLKKGYLWTAVFAIVAVLGVVFAAAYYSRKQSAEIVSPPAAGLRQETAPNISPSVTRDEKDVSASGPVPENALRPGRLTSEQSKITAFQSLFREWDLKYDPQKFTSACDYAQTQGLRCYYQRGNLRSLIILNHPAVLRLIDGKGLEFYVTLTDIKGDNAGVVIGDTSASVPLKDIEALWLGDYILVWRSPSEYQGEIKPGAKSALAPWLDRQLSLIQNVPYRGGDNMSYDEELAERVREFQASSGFIPDGIVGPQTIIRLNASDGSNAPRLAKEETKRKE